MQARKAYLPLKYALDFLFALCLLVPSLPIMLVCILLIRLESPGSAVFSQIRPGQSGRLFRLYKLRTMRIETAKNGRPLGDMERMTRIGRFLRKVSLDELPQLLNILRGDMSFIGPRPLLKEYLPLYSPEQMRRHEVRPGISGWAQVNGRNAISWEEKFRLDTWYVDHVSPLLDAKILFLTFAKVLRRDGVDSGADNTMDDFTGNQEPERGRHADSVSDQQ